MSRPKPPGRRGLFNGARDAWLAENRYVARLGCELAGWETHLDRECRRLALSDHVDPTTPETRARAEDALAEKGRLYPPRVEVWRRLHGLSSRADR